MAQGLLKKASKPSASASKSSSGITKKGSRTFAPRKAKLVKQAKLNKKFTSGLIAKTEAMLGARAGHLEMLGQGKKKKGADAKEVGGKKSGKKT
jgi:hypothetical protein